MTQAELDAAGASSGVELPEELVVLLRLHDGAEATEADRFLRGLRLLSLREIVSMHRATCSLLDAEDLVGTWWHPQWIPFAANHDTWSRLYVDVRPGPHRGAVGHFFMESGGQQRWPSLTAYVEQLAASLENATPLDHHTPRVDESGLLVWDWQAPPRRPEFAGRRGSGA
ncbi:SMI1/KNR4 family protein [Streptomyces sp. NPDC046977]|uniref:SMI1/KNR4 family protein n=1 Tax=Streptomyces sp. NPDC046977 TaxID=3154703 RepID=UPI0033E81791